MPLRIFAAQLLKENLSEEELSDLVADFKAYKSGEVTQIPSGVMRITMTALPTCQ